MIAAMQQGYLPRAADYQVRLFVDSDHRTPDQVDATVRDSVREMSLNALPYTAARMQYEQHLEPPANERLSEIGAPTFALVGALDHPEFHRAAEVMAVNIPGAQQAVINHTGHLPNMERPTTFNRMVKEFLALV